MKKEMKVAVVLFFVLAMHCVAMAGEAEPVWTSSTGLTYIATGGNTDTSSLGFDAKIERKPTPWGLEIIASANQTRNNDLLPPDDKTTAERYFAGARAKRMLAERWDLFVGISWEQNEFAGIDRLILTEAGTIYKALLGPTHNLAFDLGLTWADEDRVNDPQVLPMVVDVDYFGAVAGLTYEWKISESAVFSERLIYYPNFDESKDWLFSSDTALTASLSDKMALRLGYDVRYRHLPIGTNASTDTTTKVSLVVKF